jgi:RNA polymerase sigma-70 factor (ECF subfamily)
MDRLREDAAEEVLQEVCQRVFAKLKDFRRDAAGQSFRAWLRAITKNCVRDYWGRNPAATASPGGDAGRRVVEGLSAPASSHDGSSGCQAEEIDEQKIVLRQALSHIEPEFAADKWQAFWRVVVDGQSPSQVAGELGISVNSVYVAKARILRRFREEFDVLVEET